MDSRFRIPVNHFLASFSAAFSILLLLQSHQAQFVRALESYVVYMGSHSGDLEPQSVHDFHHGMLTSVMDSEEMASDSLLYSYKHYINGFAAILDPHHVTAISEMPGVISIFPNRAHQLHTTRSWEFLGLQHPSGAVSPHSLWKKAKYGDGVIVGLLDTGVWPESESFDDTGLGPIPGRWKGSCESGQDFSSAHCNRKLIGARYFVKGLEAASGPFNESAKGDFRSARDKEGHGSHTASTAAGSRVAGANEFGFARGTATGGAPLARVAIYKVCWTPGCFDADILAAIDAALHDGVDVLSMSLGASPPLLDYFSDGIAIGSFHAAARGRLVVCSAGNDGPAPGSISNVAPWIFTIAASSIDRDFPARVSLGDGSSYRGFSLSEYKLKKEMYGLVFGGDVQLATANSTAGHLCFPGSLDPTKVKGKIVACIRGVNARVEKGAVVKRAGGVGLLLLNKPSDGNEILSDPHVLPASHLNAADSISVLEYINKSRSSALAYISYPRSELNAKPAPQMASFSSQGPNTLTPDILKPDITAPGLNILAAWTQASGPTSVLEDHRVVKYNVISGTSMSCPHVSGIVALMRALYPTWSPAAIKSALMTSASHHDNTLHAIRNASLSRATPFNYGSGHVNPNAAADPGLVYDTTPEDYVTFLRCSLGYNTSALANVTGQAALSNFNTSSCPLHRHRPMSPSDLNYPSVSLQLLGRRGARVSRTVTYVGGGPTYEASLSPIHGFDVEVSPSTLHFTRLGQTKRFRLKFRVSSKGNFSSPSSLSTWVFGYLTWTDGVRRVSSPIAVQP